MPRVTLFLIFMQFCVIQYGQIIADHTVVDKYSLIPQVYIDEVKKMLVDIPGESHSAGYRKGLSLLQDLDSRFKVSLYYGTPEPYTANYLRFGGHGSVGEEDLYVKQSVIDAYKAHITSQNSTGNTYSVMGYAWCTEMYYLNWGEPLGLRDPVYNIPWYGESVDGPDGSKPWGLDNGDKTLTGNTVSMDSYFNAMEQYMQHCYTNSWATKVIFTTGPVDNTGGSGNLEATQQGFQREVKHEYIRSYVAANSSRILFDYADILCWNNSGQEHITNWNDGGTIRPHANIHPDNTMDLDASWNMIPQVEDGDHIGEAGALRLGKAMWWMLARIAGWDGGVITGTNDSEPENKSFKVVKRSGDGIEIELSTPFTGGTLRLINLYGSVLEVRETEGNLIVFNSRQLDPGIYLVNFTNSLTNETQKIIIL